MASDFKYDVAFSFLAQDEAIATQLNDLVSERLVTFIYHERQLEIAGTDGEEAFARAFREESRVVVVLYREGWGEKTWTQIEQTAIRNRAFESGYDFVLFIPLDKPPAVPIWLPKTQLWIGIDRWGISGAVAVIEARVQQQGGTASPESIENLAARLKRELEIERERKKILSSARGVELANAEMDSVYKLIIEKITNINQNPGLMLSATRTGKSVFVVAMGYEIGFYWHNQYSNTLDDSHLNVDIYPGSAPKIGMYYPNKVPQKIVGQTFDFSLDNVLEPLWKQSKSNEFFKSEPLVDRLLSLFLETIRKRELGQR